MTQEEATKEYKEKLMDHFDKFCPLIDSGCQTNCIHYDAGGVYTFIDEFLYHPPRCRLWGSE